MHYGRTRLPSEDASTDCSRTDTISSPVLILSNHKWLKTLIDAHVPQGGIKNRETFSVDFSKEPILKVLFRSCIKVLVLAQMFLVLVLKRIGLKVLF